MQAIVVQALGDPSVLTLRSHPIPDPGPGEVLVRIEAAGVNFTETEKRRGVYNPPALPWIPGDEGAGVVEATGAVFEAKFMLPWSFSEEGAAEKYMAQLQHNMWVTNLRTSVLSIITGGGKWVEMTISADPLYQHLLLTAEKKFWRCAETAL